MRISSVSCGERSRKEVDGWRKKSVKCDCSSGDGEMVIEPAIRRCRSGRDKGISRMMCRAPEAGLS